MTGSILATIVLLVLSAFTSVSVFYVKYIDQNYTLHRVVKQGVVLSYEEETAEGAFSQFERAIAEQAPKGFNYHIQLVNHQLDPKLVHFKVDAIHQSGYRLFAEKAIMEESDDNDS